METFFQAYFFISIFVGVIYYWKNNRPTQVSNGVDPIKPTNLNPEK